MDNADEKPGLKRFETGAVRSTDADATAYTLISPIALRAEAEVLANGARKYGEYNWEKGMGVRENVEHAIRHLYLYLEGDRSEPHLAHARTDIGFAIHGETMWPHLNQDLRREGCVPPNMDDATAAEWARLRRQLEEMKEKRDVAEVRPTPENPWPRGLYMDGDGTLRSRDGRPPKPGDPVYMNGRMVGSVGTFVRASTPPRPDVRTRYHFVADPARWAQMDARRNDLRQLGAEVVSRWIDLDEGAIPELEEKDIQLCEVIVLFNDDPDHPHRPAPLEALRVYGKKIVVIGKCPPDIQCRSDSEECWFPTWASFLQNLSHVREGAMPR